ncbi:hypothetical protein JW721_03590 [Candidatus Micrarchaeota archaeon]|nr:hypothetical protein [Candidatus Micrarchaeota archaeon]
MSPGKERFQLTSTEWKNVSGELEARGYSDGKDYMLIEKPFTFQVVVTTSNDEIKGLLQRAGAENKGQVELKIIVPERTVDEIVLLGGTTKDEAIAAIEESEGGYKYRHGVNFNIEERGGELRVSPTDDTKAWGDLSDLLTGDNNPVMASRAQEGKRKKATV